MKFGAVPLGQANGAILAHSLMLADGPIRKGRVLGQVEIDRLQAAGLETVIVAEVGAEDLSEDAAAALLGEALLGAHMTLGPVFTGRVNLLAETAGVIEVDAAAIAAANAVDEGLTVATLPNLMRVAPDQLLATVKVIPYGIAETQARASAKALEDSAIQLHPFLGGRARLVQTTTPGFKPSLIDKGEAAVRARVEALGYQLEAVDVVDHETSAVAEVLSGTCDLVLILGASATSDRLDVAPAAVVQAGGSIARFGMPVDPGNLLFLGALGQTPVVGLPGCARSPALNGVDWVLERLAAGLSVSDADIAAMGVGGLLKEMPDRPQPRRPKA